MVNPNKNFWRNKKVLITGYEGFLGSHLTRALITLGARITGMDIKVHRRQTILACSDYRKIKVVKGNVANLSAVKQAVSGHKIEVVFHLAAEALVGRCLKAPLKGFASNIQGTWNILEAARSQRSVKAIILASSDKAYGRHKKLPYREDACLKGDHPYDVSKSCADLIAQAYCRTYRTPVCTTRCGNIYGPGDYNFSRLVPDAVRSALTNETLKIRSDGKYIRDYVYVDDIVRGYILLAEKMNKHKLAGEAFNFSDEHPLSVLDAVKQIYRIAGIQPKYKILNQADFEIPRQYLASHKARRVLGWKPCWSFTRGIQTTLDWYRKEFLHEK